MQRLEEKSSVSDRDRTPAVQSVSDTILTELPQLGSPLAILHVRKAKMKQSDVIHCDE
jgi:hypothetical protein